MADRILTFHSNDIVGVNARIGATYYIEATYSPVAVRIHNEHSPTDGDLEVDIKDEDGVSIFVNTITSYPQSTSVKGSTVVTGTPKTSISLSPGQTTEELINGFNGDPIEEGTWLHCEAVNLRGVKNITVHLELEKLSEDE